MKSAGLGIQLPLLSHVTLRVVSVVFMLKFNISFSQVSVKIEPSRVELKFSLMLLSISGSSQSAVTVYDNDIIAIDNCTIVYVMLSTVRRKIIT